MLFWVGVIWWCDICWNMKSWVLVMLVVEIDYFYYLYFDGVWLVGLLCSDFGFDLVDIVV